MNGGPLIAIHKARFYKRKDGLALGPGKTYMFMIGGLKARGVIE